MHTYEKRGAKKKERRVGELLPTVSSSPTEYTYEKKEVDKKEKKVGELLPTVQETKHLRGAYM